MAHLLLRLDTNASARLRHLAPFVLKTEGAVTLELPTGTFSGPVERCRGLVGRRMLACVVEKYKVKIYNPSVARAPPNLCARCKYVSHSTLAKECGWFATCDLGNLKLRDNGEAWLTVAAEAEL